MRTRRSAFTLIELLVVIAIIGILASIFLPAFAEAKEAAKNAATVGQLKQIGTACLLYTADFDDAFPLATKHVDGSSTQFTTWQSIVQPYKKSEGITLHPKLPRPVNFYQANSHFGLVPRAASRFGPVVGSSGYFERNDGGIEVLFDGVAGAGKNDDNEAWKSTMLDAPSYTTTEITSPSTMMMLAETVSGWDFKWQVTSSAPMSGCSYWFDQRHDNNVMGYVYHFSGPSPIKKPGKTVGAMGASTKFNCYFPNGTLTYVATDGSAQFVDFRGKLCAKVQQSDGKWAYPILFAKAD